MRVVLTLEVAGKKFRVQRIHFDYDCKTTTIIYNEYDPATIHLRATQGNTKEITLMKIASVQECMSKIAEQERLHNENK